MVTNWRNRAKNGFGYRSSHWLGERAYTHYSNTDYHQRYALPARFAEHSQRALHGVSVSLQPYASQGVISITTSLIALICGIIGAIELFFGIQRRLESDMVAQRDYYLLSVDIFKTLSLAKHNRPIPAKDYLEKSYNTYQKLVESSNTLARRIDDQLIPLAFGGVVVAEPEQSTAE